VLFDDQIELYLRTKVQFDVRNAFYLR